MLSKSSYVDIAQVLKDPVLLMSFEKHLKYERSEENLLFIEAVNQLRHGTPESVEETLSR